MQPAGICPGGRESAWAGPAGSDGPAASGGGGAPLHPRGWDNDDYKIVFLQNEQHARPSGRLQYFHADTTFEVVAPGSARTGVSEAAVDASAPKDGDWHNFSAVQNPVALRFVHHTISLNVSFLLCPFGTSVVFGSMVH